MLNPAVSAESAFKPCCTISDGDDARDIGAESVRLARRLAKLVRQGRPTDHIGQLSQGKQGQGAAMALGPFLHGLRNRHGQRGSQGGGSAGAFLGAM